MRHGLAVGAVVFQSKLPQLIRKLRIVRYRFTNLMAAPLGLEPRQRMTALTDGLAIRSLTKLGLWYHITGIGLFLLRKTVSLV